MQLTAPGDSTFKRESQDRTGVARGRVEWVDEGERARRWYGRRTVRGKEVWREEEERLEYRRHLITSYNYSRLEALTAV